MTLIECYVSLTKMVEMMMENIVSKHFFPQFKTILRYCIFYLIKPNEQPHQKQHVADITQSITF